jgi:hypothetical protein
MFLSQLQIAKTPGTILGTCAQCERDVYESRAVLDDNYKDWAGQCPYCEAINVLSDKHGTRGYSSVRMYLKAVPDPEAPPFDLATRRPARSATP